MKYSPLATKSLLVKQMFKLNKIIRIKSTVLVLIRWFARDPLTSKITFH